MLNAYKIFQCSTLRQYQSVGAPAYTLAATPVTAAGVAPSNCAAHQHLVEQHPHMVHVLFDLHFLQQRTALLAQLLQPTDQPTPTELAWAWIDQYPHTSNEARNRAFSEALPVAVDVLSYLKAELRHYPILTLTIDSDQSKQRSKPPQSEQAMTNSKSVRC